MSEPFEITPQQAAAKLQTPDRAVLIDVREPQEHAMAHLSGSQLIPMQNVPAQLPYLEGLADDHELLILCHHGVRSLQVAAWLREHGVENCVSISGGIDRWSLEIDPGVPRY
jgi:rhodanese-related sulfurtransferase